MARRIQRCFSLRTAALVLLATPFLPAQKFVENGVAIDFSATPAGAPAAALRENSDITFRFRVSEQSSGNPITSRRLAVWIDKATPSGPARFAGPANTCQEKVKGFLEGSFFYRPAADLNSYYVLTLNREPSISVVDPLVSYGETHELVTVTLPSPGVDWAIDERRNRLLITLAEGNKLALVDTATWKLKPTIDLPGKPGRIVYQPDRQYFWVAWQADDTTADSGVAVFNSATLARAAMIETGKGSHEIAFTADSRFAFITNHDDADAAVVDVQKLSVTRRERTGRDPAAVDFSSLSGMAYITSPTDGTITAIAVPAASKSLTIRADPGIGRLRFAPGGRLAFALNTVKNQVYVIDVSINQIIQTGDVEKEPDQIVFSDELAYIRHRKSETVLMIPLAATGQAGAGVHVADFPAGQHPLGGTGKPSLADGIAQAPGENAVWVSNQADRMIYYYMEGMAAPKGSFVIGEEPRAVLVLDRSLRQTTPGVYETIARVPVAGQYQAAMLLDNPQLIHCFDFSVEADPSVKTVARRAVTAEMLPDTATHGVGDHVKIRFRLSEGKAIKDVRALVFLPAGVQDRLPATPVGDGIYEIDFQPGAGGMYQVFVESPSLGLTFSSLPAWNIRVEKAQQESQHP